MRRKRLPDVVIETPDSGSGTLGVDESSANETPSDDSIALGESDGALTEDSSTSESASDDMPDSTYDISGIENPNACEILTAADVEDIAGVPVGFQELGGACQYDGDDELALEANIRAQAIPGVARAAAKVDSANTVQDIVGLGDDAMSVVNEEFGEAFIQVSSGPYLVQVGIGTRRVSSFFNRWPRSSCPSHRCRTADQRTAVRECAAVQIPKTDATVSLGSERENGSVEKATPNFESWSRQMCDGRLLRVLR